MALKNLFGRGPYERATHTLRSRLIQLLVSAGESNNHAIRQQRDRYIDELIDLLFNIAADLQRREFEGWTADENCQLKPHQQLWLDPWRAKKMRHFLTSAKKVIGKMR